MKSNVTNHSSQTKEKQVMQKFIVEAEAPQANQVASSGGVRAKDGSLVSQYKNPKPYIEPSLPAIQQSGPSLKDELKKEIGNVLLDTVYDLWNEFARPVVSAKLHQLGEKIISTLEQPQPLLAKKDVIIDADIEEIEFSQKPDNIIRFPDKQVI